MSIQVRNFTPFPVRDTVTSSLSATGPPPSDCVDDMELTLGRRRSRRISTNSLGTIRTIRTSIELNRSDQTSPTPTTDSSSGRPRANSRTTRKSVATGYQHRPARERATSSASIQSLARLGLNKPRSSLSAEDISPPTSPILALPDEAELQTELEQVVASRLVETFLTLEPWYQEEHFTSTDHISSFNPSSPIRSALGKFDHLSARIRSGSGSSRVTSPRSATFRPTTPSKNHLHLEKSSRPASPSNLKVSTSRQSASSSAITQSPRAKRGELAHTTSHALPTPAPSPPPSDVPTPPPFYISAFHRPSTNPSFTSLDAKHDFATWADLGSHRFRAFLWGTGGSEWGKKTTGKEKAKERNPLQLMIDGTDQVPPDSDWDILASWEVDMDDLVPLPAEVCLLNIQLPLH